MRRLGLPGLRLVYSELLTCMILVKLGPFAASWQGMALAKSMTEMFLRHGQFLVGSGWIIFAECGELGLMLMRLFLAVPCLRMLAANCSQYLVVSLVDLLC